MAKLIDAKQLEKQIKYAFAESDPFLMGQMLRWIRKQTQIDAVSVVRCKKCKHCIQCENGYVCDHIQWREGTATYREIKLDDFCSYGTRKGGVNG